jgi:hopanoid biosynthesis associated RND transporter like protein HpnN
MLAISVAGISVWYTAMALEFETSRNAMASSRAPYIQLQDEIKANFSQTDYIVVAIEPPTLERGKQFVQALALRLQADTKHFEEVVSKIDTASLDGKKLLLLSPDELHDLKSRLADSQDLVFNLSQDPGLVQLLTAINQEMAKAFVKIITDVFVNTDATPKSGQEATGKALDVSFLAALFAEMDQALANPTTYHFHSPWASFFLNDGDILSEDGFLTSSNDRFLFVLVDDRTTTESFVKHAEPLRILRQHIRTLQRDFPEVQVGVTGSKALNNDEMLTAQHDTILATIIALIGVAILFIVAFRQLWRPLFVVATLVVAICWTIGFTTLTIGHLNILSVAFMPILIGLGIDFGIHLLARYVEERAAQADFKTALYIAYQTTGPGIVAAGLTTTLAFYAIMLSDFRGLVELGFIAGSGMLLCLLGSFTVLPALLAVGEKNRNIPPGVWQAFAHDPLQRLKRYPRIALAATAFITLAGIVFLAKPSFDYNLLNLQAQNTESVRWEYRLLEGSDRSSWYALNVADSLAELYRKKAQFAALPVVDRVSSIASVLPENQTIRLKLVQQLAPYIKDVAGDWDRPEPIDLDELSLQLRKIRFKLQKKPSAWEAEKRPSEVQLTAARSGLLALQERLQTTPASTVRGTLETFQRALLADFAAKLELLQRNSNPTPITLADLPSYLRQRYVGKHDQYLLQIFSRDNIWEREPMREFVTQLLTVDPAITGSPVVAFYSIRQMLSGYTRGGLYALLVILAVIVVLFRRFKATLLAIIPVLVGGLWTMACMALFDLSLNMANLILVPLFIGIAVDDGIHLVHRMLESPEDATSPLARSTGKAIVLTSLTSMVGFGSLMVAKHSGVFSLGVIAATAVGCALLATLVILPLILHLVTTAAAPSSSTSASTDRDLSSHF